MPSGFLTLESNSTPEDIQSAFSTGALEAVGLDDVPPAETLSTLADALRVHPTTRLHVNGSKFQGDLDWLDGFSHIEHLVIAAYYVTSYDVLSQFDRLKTLALGDTQKTGLSLEPLRGMVRLRDLFIHGKKRHTEVVQELTGLRQLMITRTGEKSLEFVREHPSLESVTVEFGSAHDLSALGTVPGLKALGLYQIQRLDDAALEFIASTPVIALSLGALPHVTTLRALTGRPRDTLRFLILEGLSGLGTLEPLAACRALEQVFLIESRPKDRNLGFIARAPRLRHLLSGDPYSRAEQAALLDEFHGETLWIRGKALRGDLKNRDILVQWRKPVDEFLEVVSRERRRVQP